MALLLCDAGEFGDPWKVANVAKALGVSSRTIEHLKQRFVEEGLEVAWLWLLLLVKCPSAGFSLDLDSTVFCREGQQEGVRKGFNPRRKGRNSHHPLLAVLAERRSLG